MKQFLYLDTDIVNSIIAQSENGLVESFSQEEESIDMEGDSNNVSIDAKGGISGGLAKLLKAEANLASTFEFHDDNSFTTTSREIYKKTLHDAAFNIVYEEINANVVNFGEGEVADSGEYIELKRVFDFVDLDYLEGLFAPDGIIDFIKDNESAEIRAQTSKGLESLNRDQRRSNNSTINKVMADKIKENNKKYDDAITAIKAIRGLVPYNRILISNDGYLIPLNDKYFRIDFHDLGFKYGGEITCVGMISNIIGEDTNPNDTKNIFATIQFLANEALRMILPTSKSNLIIVHPIAVYYGR